MHIRLAPIALCTSFLFAACDSSVQRVTEEEIAKSKQTLTEARRGHTTKIVKKVNDPGAPETPPATLFSFVKYPAPLGNHLAYISKPVPAPGKKPAIIWLVGGFSNGIGDNAWMPGPAENDQSASVFWKSGIITMYPALRGGTGSPGYQENFFGEVDDVLAAVAFLARQPDVDPQRIYLGGHSTGGTLSLLVAETGIRFRGVFSFGPVGAVQDYGDDVIVYDKTNAKESDLRAPILRMNAIAAPTFVIEGARGNRGSLEELSRAQHPPTVKFFTVGGADHFSVLRPISALIAKKILADTGANSNIDITDAEIKSSMAR
jgi:alpha/beta superfamily hydrolase